MTTDTQQLDTFKLSTKIVARLQVEGIHRWANCPIAEVSYLRKHHRHMFHIIAHKTVEHNDRDIEFIQLTHNIKRYLTKQYYNDVYNCLAFGDSSCEMIATELVNEFNLIECEVNEDGESGAVVSRLPTITFTDTEEHRIDDIIDENISIAMDHTWSAQSLEDYTQRPESKKLPDTEYTFDILRCDAPSMYTGIVYTRQSVVDAMHKYRKSIEDGTAIGTLGFPSKLSTQVNIADASHVTTDMRIDGDVLRATIRPLKTPNGIILTDLLQHNAIRVSPITIGESSMKNNKHIMDVNDIVQTVCSPLDEDGDI